MFENIKNYNDLKTLFNTNDKTFNTYSYLKFYVENGYIYLVV